MQIIATGLPEVFILEPKVFDDPRGYFMETFSESWMNVLGHHTRFVQDNQSFTQKKNTLRGIHFQMDPMAQCKIVRVVNGAIHDFAIDLRKGSPNYLKWTMAELNADNKRMLYVPRGFGHGFVTLTDDVVCCYKADNLYSKECDRSIRFDDPQIQVNWGIASPVLSQKDMDAPVLSKSDCNFIY
jgi:dTDP-4-dehydrorhamnose 3,5-epimerase